MGRCSSMRRASGVPPGNVPPSVWQRAAQGERERAIARADLPIIENNSTGSTLRGYEKSRGHGRGSCGLDAGLQPMTRRLGVSKCCRYFIEGELFECVWGKCASCGDSNVMHKGPIRGCGIKTKKALQLCSAFL